MKTAPDPKDVQDFQFKQSCISQILNAYTSIPRACSLLAADKKRGLIYAAQNNKITILKPGEDSDPEWKIELNVSVAVSKLMLNCDCSYLAVASHGPLILIYDAQAFARNSVQLLYDIRISTSDANVFVTDLRWNPAMPGMLCTVASDYTIGSFKVKEKKEKAIELKALEKFNGIDAMCAAWSPKGKQIVVGCKNGNIVQFKPDLKVARTIPGPTSYIGEIVSILWISNYQFCAAYLGSEQRINVLIVDAPKGETNAIFTCYEDITYGLTDAEGQGTVPCYYFDHVPEWGLIIAASSNSSEIAVLGSTDGRTWNLWQLVDSGRAELPLICTTESYPVGLTIDKSPIQRLPWGADSTLPNPVPILHILATSGQLCSFHMVNLTPNCPPINSPPTEIVTPPPEARSNVVSEASVQMNGAITSTPRLKQSENILERSKPVPTGNIFNKFVEGNSFFMQSPTEKPKQQEQQSESTNIVMKIEETREAQPQVTIKQDVKSASIIKEPIMQEPVAKKSCLEDDNSKDIRAYLEEHYLFEKELRNRLEPQTWECGTEEERRKLIDQSFVIDQFLRQLREATNSLSSDIACLKALLLQSFAWTEETKSKNAATDNITTRSCDDSNKIADLQRLYYYTQTQLSQASKILDLEWSDHTSQEMSRMKIPHLEFVYQNMILHNEIIQEEKGKVEDLKKQWKLITRNISVSNLNITSSKSSTILRKNAAIIEARCKAIAAKTLSFTQEKQIKLKEHLSISTPKVIKPVNPSLIQHRLEAILSSLAYRNNTCIDTKTKAEQTVSKHNDVSKQQAIEKPELQSPLAFLDSIVARIGTNEANNLSVQNKMQSKQPNFDISLPSVPGSKLLEEEKKHNIETTAVVSQSTQSKQDTITFNQVTALTNTLANLLKSFPIANTNTCETSPQKPDGTAVQKTIPTKSSVKCGKEVVLSTESSKLENNLFNTTSLKDALTSETPGEKPPTVTANTELKFGLKVPTTATKSEAMSTFSFATPTAPAPVKSTVQSTFVAPRTTSAEAFSFALKPSSTSTPFNLKITPSTVISTTQAQDTPTFTDSKYSYKPTFGTPGFETLLGQNTDSDNEFNINAVSEAPSKDRDITASLVTIEEVLTIEAKALNLKSNSVQVAPASSAAPLFGTQANAPNATMYVGMSSLPPPVSTFTVTTTIPAVETTTTSSTSMLGGFNYYKFITTPDTVSSFKNTSPKNTFGESATNLPTSSINPATTTTPTLTFGNGATTSTSSTFVKPALTTNTEFQQNTPPVSSTANTFGNPVLNPTSMGFVSTTNSSIFGSMPATSTTASIFSGSSTNSIFGGNTRVSSAPSTFGGNTASINTFETLQKFIFDNNTAKSESIFDSSTNTGSTSFFGEVANTASPGFPSTGSTAVFGAAPANVSPMGVEQPTFGQSSTKPVFGSPSSFGAPKLVFGGGFGSTTFGATPATPTFGSPPGMVRVLYSNEVIISKTTFGSPPGMGETPAPIDNSMPKVFGNVSGNSTFESLASQPDGLTFSSLAQNSAEPPKSPVFTTSSSFSTWR